MLSTWIAGVTALAVSLGGTAVAVNQALSDEGVAETTKAAALLEVEDVARFASMDYTLNGGSPAASLTAAVSAWPAELGLVALYGETLTYAGDGWCWQLTVTDDGVNALASTVVPC